MKAFIVLAALVAIAAAFPQTPESTAQVLSHENTNIGVGEFQAR